MTSSGVVEPSSSSSCDIKGCCKAQSSELATCLILRSELDLEAKGDTLLCPPTLESSGEAREGIDSVDTDLVLRMLESSPLLPTNICPSINPSMLPKSPSNCAP
jgi:hypothetical protein